MKPYKTITLRLDAAHYARLAETARITGLKIEPMLRQLIMGVQLRPRPPDTYQESAHDVEVFSVLPRPQRERHIKLLAKRYLQKVRPCSILEVIQYLKTGR